MADRLGTVAMNGLVLRAAQYPGDEWVTPTPAPVSAAVQRVPRQRRALSRRPMATVVIVCTVLCSLIPRPAYADPTGTIPDTGTRPIANGSLVLPGKSGTTGSTPPTGASASTLRGPLAAQLAAAEIEVNTLGQQRLQASLDLETAQGAAKSADERLLQAKARVADLRSKSDSAAAEAYKHATGLGPLDGYADDLHQWGLLAPGLGQQPGGQADARDLLRAEEEEKSAQQEVDAARAVVQQAQQTFMPIDAQFQTKDAAYRQLVTSNDAAVLQIKAQEDAYEQTLGVHAAAANVPVDGMVANPKAVQALNYALGKIGSWYVWGDEGPSTFDCSGLAYWAYGQVGVHVPRVANDMYHGTQAIVATKNTLGDRLLPGDLIFFASDPSDWRSIYHMGIYIGGGQMVNAPTTGEKVKVAQVKWSRFYGATRIFPAVAAPGATAQPPVTTTTPPAATTPPATTPSASASASASASPSASPSASASASPSASATASPSASASASKSAPPAESTSTPAPTKAPSASAAASKTAVKPAATGSSTTAQATASATGS